MEDLLNGERLVDARTHPTAAEEVVGQLPAFGQADEPDAWTPFSLDGPADALLHRSPPLSSPLSSTNDPMLSGFDLAENTPFPLGATRQEEVRLPLDLALGAVSCAGDKVPLTGDDYGAYDGAFEQRFSAARSLFLNGAAYTSVDCEQRLRYVFQLGWDGGYERCGEEALAVAQHDPSPDWLPVEYGYMAPSASATISYYWEHVRLVRNPDANVKKWFEDRYHFSRKQVQTWIDNRRRKERNHLQDETSHEAAAIRAKDAKLGRDQAAEVANLNLALQAGVRELTSGLKTTVVERPWKE